MKKTKNKTNALHILNKFKYLFHSVRQYKKYAILSIVFVAVETLLECIIPFIMQLLVDELGMISANPVVDKTGLLNTVLMYAGILLLFAAFSLLFGILAGRMSAYASSGFARNLREDEFKKITTFSFQNIDKFHTSSLITRQTTDVTNIQFAFMLCVRIAVRAPLMFIFAFTMACIVAAPMTWIFAITVPLITILMVIIIPIATRLFVKLFRKYDDLNEQVEEDVRGMRVVKTYAREDFQKEKFRKESEEMGRGFQKVERLLSATNPGIQFIMYISMCLILFVGSMVCIKLATANPDGTITFGALTIGSITALITYSAQVLSSLMMVAMVLFMIVMAVPAINRVYEVLVEEPSIKNNDHPICKVKDGDIVFENVSFKYKEDAQKFALQNINLHIKNGETIGIIGGTGSSKSTLVNLLSRFYDATEGSVKIGGVDVKDYDIKTLRNNVAMVLQKNVLFSGTIKDNLKWGNKDATDEEIIKAAKVAQADPFIQTFPKGYDSWIEQGGVNVSGGQRQRLCIARALLKNPKVLILDDSTSAVDTKTDAYIRKGLKELQGVTKIIIAQRISSVQDADRILVMDNGELSGVGTHEELLKNNAIYQEVYEIQNRIGGAH